MIPQATIERITDAANILDVVSEYVTLRRSGASYKGLCPFHDDKTPSFYVSPAKGLCKCFSCGQGGNAVHFIMELEQLTYIEALKFLAKKYNIEVEEKELTPEQKQSINERESLFAVNEWAANYYHDILKNDIDGKTIGMTYFRNRGFRDDIIEKFKLGFSLDKWDELIKAARNKGYKDDYVVNTGLCYKKDDGKINDRFRGRVMFPWFNASGKVVAFGGRVLDSRTKGVSQKYVNSPESAIYSKAKELYGIYQAKKQIAKDDLVYMVEGYTDVISMHQCGIENVVANSGTALSYDQIHLLHRYTNNITLLYDGDEAGIHAALRGTDMLLAEGMNVKILLLPDGDDPDSFARKHNASEFKAYVEEHQTDFIIFKTGLLLKDVGHDPIKKANLTKDIVKSISVIPEEIIRSTYIHECSEMLGYDEQVLLRETQKNRKQALEEVKKEAERERERARYLAQKEAEQAAKNETSTPQGSNNANMADTSGVSNGPASPATPIQPGQTNTSGDPHAPSPEELEYLESLHGGETQQHSEQSQLTTGPHIAEDILNIRRETAEDKRFYGIERMIMQQLIRYGKELLEGEDENANPTSITLIEFVYSELQNDELTFRTPIYMRMLDEAYQHIGDAGFTPDRYFLSSTDLEISKDAADLLNEKYMVQESDQVQGLSTTPQERIVHMMLDYKFAVVASEIKRCQAALENPEVLNNDALCNETMTRFMQLNNIQKEIAKRLGDRILMK